MRRKGNMSKKKKRQGARATIPPHFSSPTTKIPDDGILRGREVRVSHKEKMSVVIESFVEPYLEMVEEDEAVKRLITLAIVAWNAALLPLEAQATMFDRLLGTLHDSDERMVGIFCL